ncbi:MAG TPA: tRNA pseudouridine(13) synthase TruD [Candidatus Limnocylindrales bacterium]|nr:tRNA pseudouridine(13) synthase TruD [Candidatus Limnocylindrales bacterium]
MPLLDKQLGIEVYLTKSLGIGGVIREEVEDFLVEEMLVDGSKARVNGTAPSRVLGSTLQRQRYLLCVLVKRNWDTFIAIKNIAKQLGIDQGRIQIAGIKDAKAVTAQHLTVDGGLLEDAARVHVKDLQVIPVGYVHEALSTYYLLGNYFTIRIKTIRHKQSTVETRLAQSIKETEASGGIPNFFGHQRFGTTRPITHLVGKSLVQGDFEEAAMLLLAKPSVYEHPASRKARQQLQETGNFRQALDNFPKQLRFERLMLSHLAENPDDFVGAFQRLPLKLQELFVQAHQSYLFNRFLSGRLLAGYALNSPLAGDYVVGVDRSGLPITKISKIVKAETETALNNQVKAGKMQVALPIVGTRQKLSGGLMGEIEQRILEAERVKLEELHVNPLSRAGGKGGLRTTIAPMRGLKVHVSAGGGGRSSELLLSFMLQRGCYATVLLRELMKPDDPLAAGF